MSEVIALNSAKKIVIDCVLEKSDSYVETLSIKTIDAQPGLLELVITTQLFNAKNPTEKRVKSRTCVDQSRLIELNQGISHFLHEIAS